MSLTLLLESGFFKRRFNFILLKERPVGLHEINLQTGRSLAKVVLRSKVAFLSGYW